MAEETLVEFIERMLEGHTPSERERIMDDASRRYPEHFRKTVNKSVENISARNNPTLKAEYDSVVANLAQGDIYGLDQVKRAFRKKGLSVW